ncbi:type I-F CRISPR-associated protein Csy1 [Vibrio caribbeanicus]|uniref:type I-F CRISPR-associated protein Csy1 n=1 Tax=Vibrio caribbeanicus TaxID=701175 RepID=UPI0022845B50|nr:type I-F CRISPR-associated protein Csy1 [Vibrio caribbeanicus]MCY9843449.1 type I-F CRISPR-associated protein Csy1 [Vibrio caribbeanicus]
MLTDKIENYILERYRIKSEALDKDYEKERSQATTIQDIESIEVGFTNKKEKLRLDFDTANWLDSAAKRASQISMATHAIKFTHSSAKGTNVLAVDLGQDNRYLDTAALQMPAIDAVGNAAALDVARLLQLSDEDGKSLLDYLRLDDLGPLKVIAKNDAQLEEWRVGLKQSLLDATPSSHTLAKQVYFPIADNEYHLISPLYSSSLSQAIYQEISHSRFSQEMVAAREARKKQAPHSKPVVVYPNLAITIIGGSKPQNVSQLNSGRGGRNYLFSTCPPEWQSQHRAPLNSDNIFTHPELRYAIRHVIKRLVSFLVQVNQQDRESNLAIRNQVKQLVDEVIDGVFAKVSQWQQLPLGWCDETNDLPVAQCRWLDPNNPKWDLHDDLWQQNIAKDFGVWLVANVNHFAKGELSLGLVESNQWQAAFQQALREIS